MPVVAIDSLDAAGLARWREALVDLLIDAVQSGSSVGFVLPLSREEAGRYWDGLVPTLADGSRFLWIARDADRVIGTVQLELATKKNARNRAEVQKLLVHSRARRQGVARAMMRALEMQARVLDRGLLHLDTEAGSEAERFYRALGYTGIGGLPEYACSPQGEWRANAIYYKTLFLRGRH